MCLCGFLTLSAHTCRAMLLYGGRLHASCVVLAARQGAGGGLKPVATAAARIPHFHLQAVKERCRRCPNCVVVCSRHARYHTQWMS